MAEQPSQVDRVLALLRSQGSHGLNTSSVQELPIADGGKPILRLAARIRQLKEQGYAIVSRRESNGTSTYFLESEPLVESRSKPPESLQGESLSPDRVSLSESVCEPLGLFDTSGLEKRVDYRDEAA